MSTIKFFDFFGGDINEAGQLTGGASGGFSFTAMTSWPDSWSIFEF